MGEGEALEVGSESIAQESAVTALSQDCIYSVLVMRLNFFDICCRLLFCQAANFFFFLSNQRNIQLMTVTGANFLLFFADSNVLVCKSSNY